MTGPPGGHADTRHRSPASATAPIAMPSTIMKRAGEAGEGYGARVAGDKRAGLGRQGGEVGV
jgi:hypothetical protein